MILDTLENAAKYTAIKIGSSEAFGFLDQPGVAELADGKYEINGDYVFAIVERNQGKKAEDAKLEAHRKYIDVQYIVSGEETMGWAPLSDLANSEGYDEARDLEFFTDKPEAFVRVPAGTFAVFLPTDAHMPGLGDGAVHKIIVKIAVN